MSTATENERMSLKDVRANCLECSGDSRPAVIWCTSDGVHSTQCRMWPYRFGIGPSAFRRKHGPRLVEKVAAQAHAWIFNTSQPAAAARHERRRVVLTAALADVQRFPREVRVPPSLSSCHLSLAVRHSITTA